MTTASVNVPGTREITDIVDLVTSTLLDVRAVAISTPDPESHPLGDRSWTGCIAISGSHSFAVTIACSGGFVQRAMQAMLAEDTEEAARDVLAEITNVIGGNIKSLLSSPQMTCHLALPVVACGDVSLPSATLLLEQWCRCENDPMVVSLWQGVDGGPAVS